MRFSRQPVIRIPSSTYRWLIILSDIDAQGRTPL